MEAICQEGDGDMRLDAGLDLVIDRPDGEVAFEVLERFFDADELKIQAPQLGRVRLREIGAQQIAALAAGRLARAWRGVPSRSGSGAPWAYRRDIASADRLGASRPAPPRSECRDPSARCAAPCHIAARCA